MPNLQLVRRSALVFWLACGAASGLTACGPVQSEGPAGESAPLAAEQSSSQAEELGTTSAASCTYCYSCLCRISGGYMNKLCGCSCGTRSFNPYYASCTKLGSIVLSKTKSCGLCT
jgi:hypothetical protein